MAWCANCRCEYLPEVQQCPECGASLVAELPPTPPPQPPTMAEGQTEGEKGRPLRERDWPALVALAFVSFGFCMALLGAGIAIWLAGREQAKIGILVGAVLAGLVIIIVLSKRRSKA